jgi:8-amino-3,8-dideoxy-alpha-D-manno-octulosonate transaminase
MLGAIGDAGCYSFDFNKIVTCGEGGAVVTNSKALYERADQYHDHGHDHTNDDRGAEGHPCPGYNFRISELHAAVGCGQIGKLDTFLTIHRKNKKILKDALRTVPQVTFRRLPDPDGDSATFLTFFMPTEESARKTVAALKAANVDGAFHWYDNNWHYIRKWDQLKGRKFMHPMYNAMLDLLPDYAKADFSSSDALISRTISIGIKMGWSDEEVHRRTDRITEAVKTSL